MITQLDLEALVKAAKLAGFNVEVESLQLLTWNAGPATHIPKKLPVGYAAVYIFQLNNTRSPIFLKVGKANSNSNARYQSHHYSPDSSNSNLARAIITGDPEFHALGAYIPETDIGVWIKERTNRFNILIPKELGKNFVHFAEAFFILKCKPFFENSRT